VSPGARALPISVVIPAHDAAATIARAVESVLRQTCRPAEIIVVDDGSRDATAAVARTSGASTVVSQACGGPAAARNAGVRLCSQPWIALLDADDAWNPHKLERQWGALLWATLRDDAAPGVVMADYRVFHGARRLAPTGLQANSLFRRIPKERIGPGIAVLRRRRALPFMLEGNVLCPSTLLVERSLLTGDLAFDEQLPRTREVYAAEDWEWTMRAAARSDVLVIEEPLVDRFESPHGLSGDPVRLCRGDLVLTQRVISEPQRYFPGAAQIAARRRSRQHWLAAVTACRRLDVSSARRFLVEGQAERWTAAGSVFLALLRALDHGPGRLALRASRTVWRLRPKVS
jgi:hypothetical protein